MCSFIIQNEEEDKKIINIHTHNLSLTHTHTRSHVHAFLVHVDPNERIVGLGHPQQVFHTPQQSLSERLGQTVSEQDGGALTGEGEGK